jgi:hypothetical protein
MVVTLMLGRSQSARVHVADLAGRERSGAQLHHGIPVRGATDDAMRAWPERGQIAACVDEPARAAPHPHGLDGAIDRKAFGNAAEIDANRYPDAGERGFAEVEIRHTARGAGQARIEASARGSVQPSAELEQLMSPGIEQHGVAGLAPGEAGEIAPGAGRVHQPLDGRQSPECRANRAFGGRLVGRIGFHGHERAEGNPKSRYGVRKRATRHC